MFALIESESIGIIQFYYMSKIYIGKKIKEVLDKTALSVVDFAKSINLTRNGAYKVFEKETIDTGQLQKISKVLNYDFFSFYGTSNIAKDNTKPEYGYATKAELSEVVTSIQMLVKEIEKLREDLPKKRVVKAKVYTKKKEK